MTGRRIAGWAALSLAPLTLVALAALTGQLAAAGLGVVLAAFGLGATWLGLRLLDTDQRR
ncbi:hypothetical protein [Streptomyces sp. BRB081]|uniref:hypothetical protein n=1 Tax=Streptomyces sp. BRB081 TaxID=2769544 RepID=UPI0018ACD66C|nr:hypothetical protein [Streptomyces sp. BRB081]MBL3808488.1 hypothetical protein [Streptomyces sp. BRB081]